MSEGALWVRLHEALRPFGKMRRVEDGVNVGTPDVAYALSGRSGWMELKWLPAWPVRGETPVRIPTLELEQVLFLEDWVRPPAAGTARLVLGVAREVFVLAPPVARAIFDAKLTAAGVRSAAMWSGRDLRPAEVIRCL